MVGHSDVADLNFISGSSCAVDHRVLHFLVLHDVHGMSMEEQMMREAWMPGAAFSSANGGQIMSHASCFDPLRLQRITKRRRGWTTA
jgi:hypothetical protein